ATSGRGLLADQMIGLPPRSLFEAVAHARLGSRGLVTFSSDPGWAHERLFLWPVPPDSDGGHWASYVYTPRGDFYVEQETDFSSSALLTGRKGYPTGVPQVVAFSRALEPDEVAELVTTARAEAVVMTGSEGPDPSVPDAVDWRGGRLDLPAYSPVQAPRLSASGCRLRGKQAMPLPVVDVEGAGAALVPASEPGGGAPTPLPEAADGHGWLRSDLACWGGAFALGTELRPGQPPCVGLCGRGEYGIATDRSGGHHPVELVELGRVSEWCCRGPPGSEAVATRSRRGCSTTGHLGRPRWRPPRPEPRRPTSTTPARAGSTTTDAGVRYNEWRKVLQEATQESVQTAGPRGLPVCLPVCRKFHKHGGAPKAWFAEWVREVGISRKGRAWHEVECLIECLWLAGSYDQPNVGAVAALEVVVRRLLQRVEAYAKGAGNPNWSAAKHFSATSSALDLAPEEMRTCAARQAKGELELESLRVRARAPHSGAALGADAAAAAALRGAPPRRRRRLLRDISAAIEALSWMRGGGHRPAPRQMSAPTEKKILGLQADVRQRVVEAAPRWCDVDSAVGERGALARLLKGRSGHAPAPSCSVGSCEHPMVSEAPRGSSHLRPPCAEGSESRHGDLHSRPGLRTGRLFFVAKKADKLRLIVDSRRAKQLFQKPPGVALLSGEGLSRVEIDDPGGLLEGLPAHLGVGDVADGFQRMRLVKTAAGDIRRYFCRPPLAPKRAGISEVDGAAVRPDEEIWPMCASPPMDFSWSLHFAQTANAQRLGRQPALRQSRELSDRVPSLVLGGPSASAGSGHCMSVDNAGVLSFDGDLVGRALAGAQRDFDADALRFHEMEVFDHSGPSQGWHLDGDARVARPSDKRFALVRRGVRALLRLRKVSGWQVEAVLGRVAFLCLMRRELLSIFHAVYRFVRESYAKFQRLWDSAQEELNAFLRAMLFVEADWSQPWTPCVYASDASLHGFGVSQPPWPHRDVAEVGRVPELSRHRLGGARAHEHAFEVAGFKVGPESGDVERDFHGRPVRRDREAREILEAARWEHNEDFAEVPSRLLAGDRWHTILADRWLHADNGRRLEARAVVKADPVSAPSLSQTDAVRAMDGQATRVRALTLERGLASRLALCSRSLEQGWPERRAGFARAQTTEAFLGQVADEIPGRLARAPGPADRGVPADIEGEDGSESDDSSDPEERAASAARQRALRRRGKNHVRQCLSALMGAALLGARLTPLEVRSVTEAAAAQHRQRVLAFLSWGPFSEAVLNEPARLGVALADFMNREFEQGHKSWRGEKLLAGIIFHSLRYGKNGYDKLPRTLRALKGWCRASPSRSRGPLTAGMRVSIVVEIARLGFLMAAVLTLIMVEGCLRPGEILGLTPEGNLRSKTGESDDSIPLDSRRCGWMDAIDQVFSRRPQGSERLLDWSYREYVGVFRRAAANLNWTVVPDQGRRTGASADRAENLRTQEQAMKRGRWQALRSVRRYEKAGRVNQARREVDAEDQDHVWLLVRKIEGIFLRWG
ncbi:unnamed protein product, partial [Prorocentrum cordatum]